MSKMLSPETIVDFRNPNYPQDDKQGVKLLEPAREGCYGVRTVEVDGNRYRNEGIVTAHKA